MARAKVAPFNFSELVEPVAPAAPAFGPAEIERARDAGFAEGAAAARRDIEGREAEAIASIAARLSEKSAAFDAAMDAERSALKLAAAEFLKAFASKIASDREIESAIILLSRLMNAAADRTSTVLLLNPGRLKRIGARLRKELTEMGAAQFVKLQAEPGLEPGDCRLIWRGGAANRTLRQAIDEIDAVIARANQEDAPARSRKARDDGAKENQS